jgi:hypothetical protein
MWDGDPTKTNLAVKVKPGLVLVGVRPNSSHTFHPAGGYDWVYPNDPNKFGNYIDDYIRL